MIVNLDEINRTLQEHADLARTLLVQRRQLFDALILSTLTLRIAEQHLDRSSTYVCELIARRIPLDVVARSEGVLEAVAYDRRTDVETI